MPDPFKAYDIRGLYPQELDEDLACRIGHATALVLGLAGKRFAVGRDMREGSPAVKSGFVRGLVASGVRVVDVGLVSTPCLTFAMHHLGTDGGAQITASHNPRAYAGIKITGPGWKAVGAGSGMEEIERLARAGTTAPAPGGRIDDALVADAYAAFLAPVLRLDRPLKVVVDCGNGMVGPMLQHLMPRLPGLLLIPLFIDPDGRFPNHEANPLKTENLRDLQARVIAERADFGAAFDGDGDRCALVDHTGEPIACDMTTALIAQHYLRREPGVAVAYDLRSSQAVPELITRLGGTPVETRVGHSFIKQTLKQHDAAFAGELSGHYYFRDFFNADSGLYAFLVLASIISQAPSLQGLVDPLRVYHQSGELNFKVADTAAALARIRAIPGVRVTELDGVTVRGDGWWANVRASNTEPVVRLNLEATSATVRDDRLASIRQLITGG
jgi:phosphomannomutase